MMRCTRWMLVGVLVALSSAMPAPVRAQAQPACDRACLATMLDQYLAAAGLTGTRTVTVGAATPVAVGTQCITVRPVTVAYQQRYLFLGPILGLIGGGSLADRMLTATSSMRTELAAGACP